MERGLRAVYGPAAGVHHFGLAAGSDERKWFAANLALQTSENFRKSASGVPDRQDDDFFGLHQVGNTVSAVNSLAAIVAVEFWNEPA